MKLNFHVFMLETFKGLLTIVETNHVKVLAKNTMATKAWKNIITKVEVWKRQKFALCEQVHSMKYGNKCPSFHPSPLPFISMDNDASKISPSHLLILPCPFCLRGFDLA
jgi:hypothetical protein